MQEVSRRQFLISAPPVIASATLAAGSMWSSFASASISEAGEQLAGPSTQLHVLRRMTQGFTKGDVTRIVNIGVNAWVAEQLNTTDATDLGAVTAISLHPTTQLSLEAQARLYSNNMQRQDLWNMYRRYTLYRRIHCKGQIAESLALFWNDYLNTWRGKSPTALKLHWDRTIIREHGMGNVRDMIKESVRHAEMLHYLDGWQNKVGSPNENFAREFLELHTLGVEGGYSEDDVQNLAKILTGHTCYVYGDQAGQTRFVSAWHDYSAKTLLGHYFPAGMDAEEEFQKALDLILDHPSTAIHIAKRLCTYFVSDNPSTDIVTEVGKAYVDSRGDVRAMMSTLCAHPEFRSSKGQKIRRPQELVTAACCAFEMSPLAGGFDLSLLQIDQERLIDMAASLENSGHGLFECQSPDGYSMTGTDWLNSNALVQTMKVLVRVCESITFNPPLLTSPSLSFTRASRWSRGNMTPREMVFAIIQGLLHRPIPQSHMIPLLKLCGNRLDTRMDASELEPYAKAVAFAVLASPYFLVR